MLEILRQRDVACDVIEYLKAPLDRLTLERIADMVGEPPADLVRKDKHFKDLGLRSDDYQTKQAVVALLLEHPRLMQRPIVVHGSRAVVARPPEKVLGLLD